MVNTGISKIFFLDMVAHSLGSLALKPCLSAYISKNFRLFSMELQSKYQDKVNYEKQ